MPPRLLRFHLRSSIPFTSCASPRLPSRHRFHNTVSHHTLLLHEHRRARALSPAFCTPHCSRVPNFSSRGMRRPILHRTSASESSAYRSPRCELLLRLLATRELLQAAHNMRHGDDEDDPPQNVHVRALRLARAPAASKHIFNLNSRKASRLIATVVTTIYCRLSATQCRYDGEPKNVSAACEQKIIL